METMVFRKIEIEIARLNTLYATTLYSFRESAKVIKRGIKSGDLDPQAPITLDIQDPDAKPIANNAYHFLNKIDSQFPRYLRETIFVRLISALEVFLIDVIREVFLARRDLFHSEDRIQFSVGEILSASSITDLWTKLINQELRKLQNQGFKEISKFYKNRLGIDLNGSATSLSVIQEFHDRRHILVHRLGRSDDEYRHRYNTTLKNLTITEEYLLNSLKIIQEFARFIAIEAQTKIEERKEKDVNQRFELEVKVVVEVTSKTAEAVTDRNFHYSVEDRIGCLNDILVSYQLDDPKQILILAGSRSNVKKYLQILKRLAREGHLIVHETNYIRQASISQKECRLPKEIVRKIAETLPIKPWPKHIHKDIAQKFGISNSQAQVAVDVILQDEGLSALIGFADKQATDTNIL